MDRTEIAHLKAVRCAANYRTSRVLLIEALLEAEREGVVQRKACTSLHNYCVKILMLADDEACSLIAIARKSVEIPEVKTLIHEGKISISNARRIVPHLTQENKDTWLEKAQTLSQYELRKEIVKIKPETATPECIRPVAENLAVLTIHISDPTHALWREASDVMARKGKAPKSQDELLALAMNALLEKEDPLRKAQRVVERKTAPATVARKTASLPSPHRRPLSAGTKHQITLRDGRQCRFRDPSGKRCENRRYLNVHHVLPLSRGGTDAPENLVTLCAAHHRYIHRNDPKFTRSGPSKQSGYGVPLANSSTSARMSINP